MALIRSSQQDTERTAPVLDLQQLAAQLDHADSARRRDAARVLAGCPGCSELLLRRLDVESEASVSEALIGALAQQADELAVQALLDCLRSEEVALRNDAIEARKIAGRQHPQLIREALTDSDSDVRILAIGILESLRHPDIEHWLIDLLEQEMHINVCACAIDLLCELGTERCLDVLDECRRRFVSEDYLCFTIELALARLQERRQ